MICKTNGNIMKDFQILSGAADTQLVRTKTQAMELLSVSFLKKQV